MALTMLPSLKINSWTETPLPMLALEISNNTPKPLILIDGVAGSGKTTIAEKIADELNANLVHSDDMCWNADPIHWVDEMLAGIIDPWLNKKHIAYKPIGWINRNRSGSINVDPNKALIIEGMGVCRKMLRRIATYSIWVDAEPNIARGRVVQRDLANGENGGTKETVTEFADWWDSLLMPIFIEEEPWRYVDVIINGSSPTIIRKTS